MAQSPFHELDIAEVSMTGEAVIGMVACPGRKYISSDGVQQQRNLEADLNALEAWGAQILVSLVEVDEFSSLGVKDFGVAVSSRNLRWCHLPIADMDIPGDAFLNGWKAHGSDIFRAIERGERIVVHCAGGRGRSGMIVAKWMTAFNIPAHKAITRVRKVRPGAIETVSQENYVLNGPALSVSSI